MQKKGKEAVETLGFSVIDGDGDQTTPLIDHQECAFVSFDKEGIAKCTIEQAYNDGKIEFKKPISCHLFPIRVNQYRDFEAINYEAIHICKPACECGQKLEIPVYRFLKEPLIRRYGLSWYNDLCEAHKHIEQVK